MKADTPEYRKAYERGWRYSHRDSATIEHGDRTEQPDAWYDGYLDYACGREKWHSLKCPRTDTHSQCS